MTQDQGDRDVAHRTGPPRESDERRLGPRCRRAPPSARTIHARSSEPMEAPVLSALTACVVLLPVALVLALLQLSTWRQRTRLAEVAPRGARPRPSNGWAPAGRGALTN